MNRKSLVFVITAHQEYICQKENDYLPQNELLFSAISETYLPLLNMFSNLEADGINFKVAMCITPSLCAQLSDPVIQKQYLEWLDKSIALGEAEVASYKDDDPRKALAKAQLQTNKTNRLNFAETYQQDLLSKFSYYSQKGNIELLATTATNCYLPIFADLPQAIQAQVEVGLMSHRYYFNSAPEGFWLPYMAYAPVLESIIRSYGYFYSILDSRGLLFADPIPEKGIFAPVRCFNSLVMFAKDGGASSKFDDDYLKLPHKLVYRNQNRDIGYEAETERISNFLNKDNVRIPTGYKYWKLDSDEYYDEKAANEQAKKDAEDFFKEKIRKLNAAAGMAEGGTVCSVCVFDAQFFGQEWHEGIVWLENVLRLASETEEIEMTQCCELLENKFTFQKVSPFLSSSSDSGYAEDMIDHSNDWMICYVRKAVERMIDLTNRFPSDSGLKERSLNLAAKEVLLAQSGDWAEMVRKQLFKEYAAERFKENVAAFSTVYDSLGSNSISTEWLTTMERKHSIFPWINYRVFSEKH